MKRRTACPSFLHMIFAEKKTRRILYLMDIKSISKEPAIISEEATFSEALDRMLIEHTNTLLVTNSEGILTGEVSVSDLFDAVVPPTYNGDEATTLLNEESEFKTAVQAASDNLVQDFMNSDFRSVTPDTTFIEVASVAIAEGKARMPVVDHEGRPIGMISRQGLKKILGTFMHEKD